MPKIFAGLVLFLLLACNNNVKENEGQSSKASNKKRAESDVLFDSVMASHDVAMPKMYKMERLQKLATAKADSVGKLPGGNAALQARYNHVAQLLNNAEKEMNNWMQGFKYDTLQGAEAARAQYLQAEKNKIDQVKNAVLAGLDSAAALGLK